LSDVKGSALYLIKERLLLYFQRKDKTIIPCKMFVRLMPTLENGISQVSINTMKTL
jgi:hypothetical protein